MILTVRSAMLALLLGPPVALSLAGCSRGSDDGGPPIDATRSTGDVAAGAKTYALFCAACHGVTGKGDGPGAAACRERPRDLTAERYRIVKLSGSAKTEADALVEYMKVGSVENGMPAWSSMPEADLADVAAYVMSIRPQPAYYESEE